jgi:hypothetical protein
MPFGGFYAENLTARQLPTNWVTFTTLKIAVVRHGDENLFWSSIVNATEQQLFTNNESQYSDHSPSNTEFPVKVVSHG